jgi:4-diphosphocytidyl-2-C-methyl-D-erythritol kinase
MRAPFTATWDSPAKVNLCLRIVGKRADGYHLLDSIFAAIDLRDRITVVVRDLARDRPTHVAVRCAYPGVPSDATNLAARAVEVLLQETGRGADVTIEIDKRIPPGAGLGGGSSNAATVLAGLQRDLGLDVARERLHALALRLGADVPFFLTGGCARVRGIGERIEPIRGWPGLRLLVALPPVAVSTAWAFRAYAGGTEPHDDVAGRLAAAAEPVPDLLVNDLERTVLPAYPPVARVKEMLLAAGAQAAVMSGSGSAVVALARDPQSAAAAFRARAPDVPVHCVRVLAPGADDAIG